MLKLSIIILIFLTSCSNSIQFSEPTEVYTYNSVAYKFYRDKISDDIYFYFIKNELNLDDDKAIEYVNKVVDEAVNRNFIAEENKQQFKTELILILKNIL